MNQDDLFRWLMIAGMVVTLAIAVTEILGVTSKSFRDAIPWPTISTTVGHLEDLHSFWSLIVVATVALRVLSRLLRGEEIA